MTPPNQRCSMPLLPVGKRDSAATKAGKVLLSSQLSDGPVLGRWGICLISSSQDTRNSFAVARRSHSSVQAPLVHHHSASLVGQQRSLFTGSGVRKLLNFPARGPTKRFSLSVTSGLSANSAILTGDGETVASGRKFRDLRGRYPSLV